MKKIAILLFLSCALTAHADPRPYYFNRGIRFKVQSGTGGWTAGETGFWNDDGTMKLRKADGSDVDLTSSGGATYTAASPLSISVGNEISCSTCTTASNTQTLTNKTLTAPVLGGSITGTYTLAGTPTISSPTITSPTMSGFTSASGAAVTVTSTETSGDGPAFIFNTSNSYTNNEFTVAFRNAGNDYFKLFPLGGSGVILRAFSSSDGSALSDAVLGSTTIQLRGPGGAGIGVNPGSDVVSTLGVSGTRWLAAWTRYTIVGDTSGNKPTCNSTNRGALFLTQAAGGAPDTLEVCAKSAADSYAWGTVFTAP